ncbi:hypothetical protein [Nocardioides sp. Soil805]|uniref:hypothetical protein n=1 Tax=Nocardioides sp. Soil805 TaxID=1736416 RepID=UPI000702FA4D|nr:hypothetical protein [Nocardioides sp. Soil805]KRF29439.1 hypothetical protein ASG94_20915 [Nocardioides sp. Soil805]
MVGFGRRHKEERLAALDAFRHVRRAADEDVTRFGEELAQLHVDTLASPLDEASRADYQRALDAYEDAKARLSAAGSATEVGAVTRVLARGRHAQACVLAARDGLPPPVRREPCFFDPGHGPAAHDVEWAPPGGVPRVVPVCFRDHERLTAGEQPEVRLVRLGNRRVAWFASGPLYAAWAQGWYADLVDEHRVEADRLTMLYAGATARGDGGGSGVAHAAAWTDPGAWDGGGMIGGHDYSGWHGGADGGGFGDGGGGGGDVGGGGDGGGGGGDG